VAVAGLDKGVEDRFKGPRTPGFLAVSKDGETTGKGLAGVKKQRLSGVFSLNVEALDVVKFIFHKSVIFFALFLKYLLANNL